MHAAQRKFRQNLNKALILSVALAALIWIAILLQLTTTFLPGTQNVAATPLAQTQGYPAYNGGYPMTTDMCSTGKTDYVQTRLFCNPGPSGTGRISVFSAHLPSTPSIGQSVILNASKGTLSSPAYYWANGYTCVPEGKWGTTCWWTYITQACTSAQLGQTRNEGGSVGVTTCSYISSFTSYPLNYTVAPVGTTVVANSGDPVTLEWSCQSTQTYQTAYCSQFAPFSGSCWNHVYVYSGTQGYASGSAGGGFSTGNQLYGQTTVYPTETTTYALTCSGYRNVLNHVTDTSPNCYSYNPPQQCGKFGCTGGGTVNRCDISGPSSGNFGPLHNGIADASATRKTTYVTVVVPSAPACTLTGTSPVNFGSNTTLTYVMGSSADAPTKLLLSSDTVPGTTAFIDTSPSANLIGIGGDVIISSAQSKFGGSSALFDGDGDYLTAADHADFEMGTGNFTIDVWVRPTTVAGTAGIISKSNSSYTPFLIYRSGATYTFYGSSAGSSWNVCNGTSLGAAAANTWTHLAVVRNGTSIRMYNNGVNVGTCTSSLPFWDNTQPIYVGSYAGGYGFAGYMDEVRVSKGIARWTANFTPPDAACPTGCAGQPTSANISPQVGSVALTPQPYTTPITQDTTFTMNVANSAGASVCNAFVAINPASCPANSTASSGTCVCNSGYSMNGSYQCVATDVCSNIPGSQSSAPANCTAQGDGTCTPNPGYVISGNQCVSGSIEFTANPSRVRKNNNTELRWSISGMTSCGITDKYGTTILAQSAANATDGLHDHSIAVSENQTYRLQCTPSGGGTEVRTVNVGVLPVFQEI